MRNTNAPFRPPRRLGGPENTEDVGRKIQKTASAPKSSAQPEKLYAQWRKKSGKKNKSWEGDGFIIIGEDGCVLKAEGKVLGRTKRTDVSGLLTFGGYEAMVDETAESGDSGFESRVGERGNDSQTKSGAISAPHSDKLFVLVPPLAARLGSKSGVRQRVKEAPEGEEAGLPRIHESVLPHLRPHQIEGVNFILQRFHAREGVLLADEMGLGKTLQTIAVVWTLHCLSRFKVLICCPVSLIDNWKREFAKWIDTNRIGILAPKGTKAEIQQEIQSFGRLNVYHVLIMSYERILQCGAEVANTHFDIVVCDEGHRLKSATNKVLGVLTRLETERRLVLTGTPIQNDLAEFYNMASFVSPGVFGTFAAFNKEYLKPITKSRLVNCRDKEAIAEGKEISRKLIEESKAFMLRRTKTAIQGFLKARTDLLLFCPPTQTQCDMIRDATANFSGLDAKGVLSLINVVRKICNSPQLHDPAKPIKSGKIDVLSSLLTEFQRLGEKCVVVSNFTQTLDLLESVLQGKSMLFSRLDGGTPAQARDGIVNEFNRNPSFKVFLLSAKAGGLGLNLVGASRLVLFDNDWNPLVDLQAMARIHRDGQKLPVFIYRLFTSGTIDEKILQRQLLKHNISDMFVDDSGSALDIFDYDTLRNLFSVADTPSNTHELMCDCTGDGLHDSESDEDESNAEIVTASQLLASQPKKKHIKSALSGYMHFAAASGDELVDLLFASKKITFAFVTASCEPLPPAPAVLASPASAAHQ